MLIWLRTDDDNNVYPFSANEDSQFWTVKQKLGIRKINISITLGEKQIFNTLVKKKNLFKYFI